MKKRVLSCIMVVCLLAFLLPTVAFADVDSQPPVIDRDSITLSAETATVGETITVTARITDNVAVSHVHISFWNDDTGEGNEFRMSCVEGSDLYSCQFEVTEGTPAGTWHIMYISAFDAIGNSDSMYFASDDYTFTVIGIPSPIIIKTEDVTIDKTEATVGDIVTISVKITSERKITSVSFYLTNYDAGKMYSYDPLKMQYDEESDCFIYRIEVSNTMPSGYWCITSIHAYDEYGQGVAEISETFSKGFVVYGTSADSEKPFIDNSTIVVSKDEIEYGEYSVVSVKVTDNAAIDRVTIWISNQETGKNIAYPEMVYNEETDRYEYTFTADDTVPSGHWRLQSINAHDTSGNYSIQDIVDWDTDYYILVKGENDHIWKTDEAVEPTCTSDGLTEGSSCSICGKINVAQETIEALGHGWEEATCTAPKTCKTCGAIEGGALGHDWEDATCSEPKTCKTCGEIVGKALDHDFSDNAEYCRRGCGTKNPEYTEPVSPPYTPAKPTPAPTPTPTPKPADLVADPEPVVPEQLQNQFVDVSKNDYFYDAVIWAVNGGITSGTSTTTFGPNKVCTRAEMVTFLWRVAGSPEPQTMDCDFVDVSEDAYYYKAVLWAMETKITTGIEAGVFDPNGECSRGQTVTFLYRFAGSPVSDGKVSFADIPENAYYYDAVAWASANGITSGTSEAEFSPYISCTRAQIVTFLYRYQQN